MPGMGFYSSLRHRLPVALAATALFLALSFPPHGALALTDLKKEPAAEQPKDPTDPIDDEPETRDDVTGGGTTLPMPDSLIKKPATK
jgi:hypothetical protein